MKIVFLTIGKTINKHLVELQNDYQDRLKHYIHLITFQYRNLKTIKT